MTNGIYAAVLGSRIEAMRLDVIANNMANSETPGYRTDIPYFKAQTDFISDSSFDGSRKDVSGAGDNSGSKCNFQTGPIRHTGRKADIAIEGAGFFVVQTPQGEAYTRGGNFRTNLDGSLITAGGDQIMGEGGPITIEQGLDFSFGEDGTIYVGEEAIDKLRVVDFETGVLTKSGGNLFTKSGGGGEKPDPKYTIIPEALEGSNVNVVKEMASMITAGRQFEAYQRVIKALDEINSRSSSALGKI